MTNVQSQVSKNWKKVKSIIPHPSSYLVVEITNTNVDLDLQLRIENKVISTQNNPEIRNALEYLVIAPSTERIDYTLYVHSTYQTEFEESLSVETYIIKKSEVEYYQTMYLFSQLWYEKSLDKKNKAIKLIETLLKGNKYINKTYELINIVLWGYIEIENFNKAYIKSNILNLDGVKNKSLKYKLKYLQALSLINLGKFKNASTTFKELYDWLNHDITLTFSWKITKELILGDIGVSKALNSYHENIGIIEGVDEINLAISNSLKLGDYKLTAELFHFLSVYYGFIDEKEDVLASLEIAKDYLKKARDFKNLASLYNQIGVTYYELNQLYKAQINYRKSLNYIDKTVNTNSYASLLSNLSRTYEVVGNYNLSKRYYKRALLEAKNSNMDFDIGYYMNALGRVEKKLGLYKRAISYHEKSLKILKTISNNLYVNSINSLSDDYLSINNLVIAKKYAQIALIIEQFHFTDLKDNRNLDGLPNNFKKNNSFVFLSSLNVEELNNIYLKIKKKNNNINSYNYFVSTNILLKIALKLQDYNSIKKHIKELDSYNKIELIPIDLVLDFHNSKLEYLLKQNDFNEIESIALNTINVIQLKRSSFDVSDLALFWNNKSKKILDTYINSLVKQKKYLKIFIILEKYYAINLREKRRNTTIDSIKQKSDDLQKAFKSFVNFERETLLLNDNNTHVKADEAKEHFLALNESEQNTKKIELTYLTIEELQKKLSDRELFLRYYLNDTQALVFVIDNKSFEVKMLPDKSKLRKTVKSIIDNVKSKRFNNLTSQDELFSQILPKDKINSGLYNKITVIPDGILNLLPFASINISSDSSQYIPLVSKINIERTYSASDYFADIELPNNEKTISVFSNPVFLQASNNKELLNSISKDNKLWEFISLPNTNQEEKAIEEIFLNFEIYKMNGTSATNENLLSEKTRNSNIIHIATHGFFNDENLENVGIATTIIDENNNRAPGVLAMREILYQPFKANLAVISGCETTLGKEINGEGFNSLSRGLLSQGVGSVVGTIWSISDRATPVFMKEFYSNLRANNGNVSQALNKTQFNFATLPKFRRYRHPYYWAGFVLTSSNRGISSKIFD